jgi:hypothetical protein
VLAQASVAFVSVVDYQQFNFLNCRRWVWPRSPPRRTWRRTRGEALVLRPRSMVDRDRSCGLWIGGVWSSLPVPGATRGLCRPADRESQMGIATGHPRRQETEEFEWLLQFPMTTSLEAISTWKDHSETAPSACLLPSTQSRFAPPAKTKSSRVAHP